MVDFTAMAANARKRGYGALQEELQHTDKVKPSMIALAQVSTNLGCLGHIEHDLGLGSGRRPVSQRMQLHCTHQQRHKMSMQCCTPVSWLYMSWQPGA